MGRRAAAIGLLDRRPHGAHPEEGISLPHLVVVLGSTAAFGLDFGEIYKRSVIGVRVYGVPKEEKDALTAFFARLNDDFHKRASDTEYHSGEIAYDYLRLNCAKTVGSAFRYGAGYKDLKINAPLIGITRVVTALNANLPTEMALKLLREWDARGYRMDAVLYKKYPGSTYADPHDDPPVPFKDLPNRFPSVLSLDFRKEEGQYRDYDNLVRHVRALQPGQVQRPGG